MQGSKLEAIKRHVAAGAAKLDGPRAQAFAWLDRAPGALGDAARRVNDTLGRPLAPVDELADRRAFAQGVASPVAPAATSAGRAGGREPAPVVVYHLEKHKRDLGRLTQVLDGRDVPYRLMNLEGDPATTEAVRRDAGGRKLPLVFIAGECVGAREELNALDRSGELEKKVWG
ncbi:MAG: hypothetical protein R2939_12575 [Kofleriaceae bacterium]